MKTFLQIAAALQLSLLIASASVPRALDWRHNLAMLHPFLRRLFWVYGSFIVGIIIAFATMTFLHADAMAAGEPVTRSLCAFIAVFWAARLIVQFAVFDAKPFLTNWFYKLGYRALAIVFAILVAIYAWAAFSPGSAHVSCAGDCGMQSRTLKDFSELRPALQKIDSAL